jgi:O-antigen ligase
MSILTAIILIWAAVVAAEAYRRTAPPAPRATVVLVVTLVLVLLWLFFDVFHAGARVG